MTIIRHTTMTDDLLDHVEATKDSIQNDDIDMWLGAADGQVLEVSTEITLDGSLKEITLLVTVGGPTIRVELFSRVVRGHWGSDSVSIPLEETERVEHIRDYWRRRFTERFDVD